jgi:hypothetical protein
MSDENDLMLPDGSFISMKKPLFDFLGFRYCNLLFFADSLCREETDNFGHIFCYSTATKNCYIYQAIFRSNSLERFLKFQKSALMTANLFFGDLVAMTRHRSMIIREEAVELFIKEKELNAFMLKYFTQCQNIVGCETVLDTLKEFMVKKDKEVARLRTDAKKPVLVDFI